MCISFEDTIQTQYGGVFCSSQIKISAVTRRYSQDPQLCEGMLPRVRVAPGRRRHMVLYGKESWSLVQGRLHGTVVP